MKFVFRVTPEVQRIDAGFSRIARGTMIANVERMMPDQNIGIARREFTTAWFAF